GLTQGGDDVRQRLLGMLRAVALVDRLPAGHRGAPADEDEVAGRHGPAVADGLLERHAGRHPATAGAHEATSASASSRVNAPAYRALPMIAPSTPISVRLARARRSSRDDTPPLATTGALVREHTLRYRSRLGPRSMPSLSTSVMTYLAQPSASRRSSASYRSPPSRVQPLAARVVPRTSSPTAILSPQVAMTSA